MFKYKIKESSENPLEVVIEKSNISHEFTLKEMQAEQHELRKYITQFQAQMAHEKAKMENVKEHHPKVAKMPGIQRTAAYIYEGAKILHDKTKEKCAELIAQLEESEKEFAHIEKILKLTPLDDRK